MCSFNFQTYVKTQCSHENIGRTVKEHIRLLFVNCYINLCYTSCRKLYSVSHRLGLLAPVTSFSSWEEHCIVAYCSFCRQPWPGILTLYVGFCDSCIIKSSLRTAPVTVTHLYCLYDTAKRLPSPVTVLVWTLKQLFIKAIC